MAGIAPADLHVVARGDLDGAGIVVLQATTILDVVDETRSIPSEYSWARISFPHIREDAAALTANRIFRVPYKKLSTVVVVGDAVKAAFEESGPGFHFEPARVDD